MEESIKIHVSKRPPGNNGVVSYKTAKVKRSLFRKLLGVDTDKITIIVPGENVSSVEIVSNQKDGGTANAG